MDDLHLDTVPHHRIRTEPRPDPWRDVTVPDLALPEEWDVPTLITHRAPRPRLGSGRPQPPPRR
jgi:hypothetical protein